MAVVVLVYFIHRHSSQLSIAQQCACAGVIESLFPRGPPRVAGPCNRVVEMPSQDIPVVVEKKGTLKHVVIKNND